MKKLMVYKRHKILISFLLNTILDAFVAGYQITIPEEDNSTDANETDLEDVQSVSSGQL